MLGQRRRGGVEVRPQPRRFLKPPFGFSFYSPRQLVVAFGKLLGVDENACGGLGEAPGQPSLQLGVGGAPGPDTYFDEGIDGYMD